MKMYGHPPKIPEKAKSPRIYFTIFFVPGFAGSEKNSAAIFCAISVPFCPASADSVTSFSKVRNLFASFRLKLFTTPIN